MVGKPTEVDCEITILGRDATYFSATHKVLSTPTIQAINPSVFEWVDSGYTGVQCLHKTGTILNF